MAPKGGAKKASGSSKAGTGTKKALTPKQIAKQEAKASRHCDRRDLEVKAKRVLDNKKNLGLTHHDLYAKPKGNKTFVQKLMDLIAEKKKIKGNVTDGDLHKLKNELFTTETEGQDAMIVAECKTPPRAEFQRLIGLSLMDSNAAKNRVSLYCLIEMSKDLNEQELCACYNSMLRCNSIGSDDDATHCLKLFASIQKRGWHEGAKQKYFDLMKERIVRMCMHACEAAVRNGDSLHSWYTTNRYLLDALGCGVTDLDELWNKKANLADVEHVVARAQKKNGFCDIFFVKEISAMRWQKWCATVTKTVQSMYALNRSDFATSYPPLKAELFDKALEAADKQTLEPNLNKAVTVLYGKANLLVTAKDHVHHVGLACNAVERFFCTGTKHGLVWGYLEKECAEDTPEEIDSPLAAHLFSEAKSGKETIQRLIVQSGKESHHEVLAYLANRHSLLKGKDEFYQLEIARLKALGETGAISVLKKKMLSFLPSDGTHCTFDEALKKIKDMMESKLYLFLGIQHAGEIKAAADIVTLCHSSDLYFDKASALQGFENEVKQRLPWFYCFNKRTPGTLDVEKIYGQAGLTALMGTLAAPKPPEAVDAEDLVSAVQFSWALTKPQRDRITELSTARSVTSQSLAKKARKAKKDEGKKSTTNDLAMEMSKNLFSY